MDKEYFLVNVHYLPIILFISFPFVFILTYIIAVLLGHVDPGLPYISDASATAPESCIFAQFINMLAGLLLVVIYIRYSLIKECVIAFSLQEFLTKCNYWALIFGVLGTFGLTVVANFPETSVLIVHFIGAFVCFGATTTYFWMQAICTFYLHPIGSSLRMAHFRIALSIFCTVCFFSCIVTGVLALVAYKGANPITWYKNNDAWELRLASTITEWLCSMAFCVYILTFVHEFKGAKIMHPKIVCSLSRTRLSDEALNESQNSAMIHDRHLITNT